MTLTEEHPQDRSADHHADEETFQLNGWGWWAIGGALGTALVIGAAFVVLMGLTGKPDYTGGATASEQVPAGAALASLSFVGTEFAFDPDSAVGLPELEITLSNEGAVLHNLEIEGIPGFVIEADPGATAEGSVSLDPGTYAFFCSVPGHREAGMEGTLVITEA